MEQPITPEELQREIRAVFKAGKRRRFMGLLLLLVGLLFIVVVATGYLSAQYR